MNAEKIRELASHILSGDNLKADEVFKELMDEVVEASMEEETVSIARSLYAKEAVVEEGSLEELSADKVAAYKEKANDEFFNSKPGDPKMKRRFKGLARADKKPKPTNEEVETEVVA